MHRPFNASLPNGLNSRLVLYSVSRAMSHQQNISFIQTVGPAVARQKFRLNYRIQGHLFTSYWITDMPAACELRRWTASIMYSTTWTQNWSRNSRGNLLEYCYTKSPNWGQKYLTSFGQKPARTLACRGREQREKHVTQCELSMKHSALKMKTDSR